MGMQLVSLFGDITLHGLSDYMYQKPSNETHISYIMFVYIDKIMDTQIYIIKSLEYIAHKLKENQMSSCTCQKKYLELGL